MGVDTACVALGHEVARVGNGGEVLLLVVLDSNNMPGIMVGGTTYLGGPNEASRAPTSTTHGADADVA